MNIDIVALAGATGIPLQVVENHLGPPPVPITETELERKLKAATTLKEINRVIANLSTGSKLEQVAAKKKESLLSQARIEASTIIEWYEVYRYADKTSTRNKARTRIEDLFLDELGAADTVERLVLLYNKLPVKSRSLSHLRREIVLKLAPFFEV